jgi:hypothetical protein
MMGQQQMRDSHITKTKYTSFTPLHSHKNGNLLSAFLKSLAIVPLSYYCLTDWWLLKNCIGSGLELLYPFSFVLSAFEDAVANMYMRCVNYSDKRTGE